MKIDFSKEWKEGRMVDPDTLFIAWYLLREYEKGKYTSQRGEGFMSPNLQIFSISWRLEDTHLFSILKKLTAKSCIKDLYIEQKRFDYGTDSLVLIATRHFASNDIEEKIPSKAFHHAAAYDKNPDFIYFFDLSPDPSNLRLYISQYLTNWQNNVMVSYDINPLSPSKQIKKVVDTIFELSESYSRNILLNWSNLDDLDFMATLLFLDSRAYLSIEDCQLVPVRDGFHIGYNELAFRIIVSDSFFLDFKKHGAASLQNLGSEDQALGSSIRFTEDGRLFYPNCQPILDLTPDQKKLCNELFSQEVGYNHPASRLEEILYGGESTKRRQNRLKKLVERINHIINLRFNLPEAIRYKTETVMLMV